MYLHDVRHSQTLSGLDVKFYPRSNATKAVRIKAFSHCTNYLHILISCCVMKALASVWNACSADNTRMDTHTHTRRKVANSISCLGFLNGLAVMVGGRGVSSEMVEIL